MASSQRDTGLSIDRRKLLYGLGAGSAALVSGCLGGDDDDDGTGDDTDDSTGNGGDEEHTLTFCDVYDPQNLQWNWMNPSNAGAVNDQPGELIYDRFLLYTPATDEYHTETFIIEDWSFDGDLLTIDISEDHYWHDGEAVTVEDVVAHWTLELFTYETTGDSHPYIDDVEEVDGSTVEFHLHDEFSEDLILQLLFTGQDQRLYTQASVYEEWIQDLEDASSEDEMESAMGELQQEAFAEPVGNGPFEFESVSEQSLELSLFEDYPTADDIQIDHVSWRAFSDGQSELQAIQAGDIDITTAISPQEESIMEQWPAGLDTPRIDMPDYGGRSLMIQHDHEILGIPEVRQAFAHVINRDNIATNTPENVIAVEVMSGVSDETADQWLGDYLDDFEAYDVDEDRAADLMEEAGFENDDGEWVDEDGDQISIEIKTHPWADTFVPVANTAAGNLSEFGIDAEFTSLEASVASSDEVDGNYEMMVGPWGGAPHPFIGFDDLFDGQIADAANVPEEYEVPPVGDTDGETETVNAVEVLNELPTLEGEEEEEAVQQLAWIVNQKLPYLPVGDAFGTGWLFTPDEWEYTTDDEGLMTTYNPALYGPRMGFLEPR